MNNYIRPDEKPPSYKTELICLLLAIALVFVLIGMHAKGAEYCFAQNTPSSFKRIVRKTLSMRSEEWIEIKTIKPWLPGPLTFQCVPVAFITPGLPGGVQLPATRGEIYRRGNISAWLFFGGARTYITVSIGIRTSRDDMISDLNYEIDLWLKERK